MIVRRSNVILDETHKNVLEEEFSISYDKADNFESPEVIVQTVNDIFHLNMKAEEYLYLLCLTTSGIPISFFEISHGTYNNVSLGGREIMIRALLCGASSIILIHTHPSGNPEPSYQDVIGTSGIRQLADLIGIGFSDHIIISGDSWFSFRQDQNKKLASGIIREEIIEFD